MSLEQRRALDEMLRDSPFDAGGDLAEQRQIFVDMVSAQPLPDDVTTGETVLGGIPAVTACTPGADTSRVLLYLHGGAYTIGTAAAGIPLASDVARRAAVRTVSVDYRLAPEHPFPAAVDDALAAYRALLDDGVPASRIAVMGESAGGGLVIATLLAARDAGLPQPASATAFSPFADLSLSGGTLSSKEKADPALTPQGLRIRTADYLHGADPRSPLASPVFADLTGLPPLLIQVGSHEILLDDALRLAARAATDDVPVELQVYPGVPHVFQGFAEILDEARTALNRAAEFITGHWEE